MRKLNKREKFLLTVFLVFLIAAVGTEFLIFPSLDKISELKSEKAELEQQWNEINFYVGTEEKLKKRIEDISKKTETLAQQLPPGDSTHVYWEFIEKSAKQSGVKIIQMQEGEVEPEADKRLINVMVSGDFSKTVAFIESINSMPYIHSVSEGSFQSDQEGLTSSISLYISAYEDESAAKENKNTNEKPVQKEQSIQDPFE